MKIDEIKKWYNSKENQKFYYDCIKNIGLWQAEEFLIKKYAKKNSKILDLGCGAGRTTFGFYELGYKNITGLDLSDKLIESAKQFATKQQINIEFVCGDACNLAEFSNNSFDIVFFSYNGFTNIPTKTLREQALNEIFRVLKNNGIYIFTAHNRDDSKYKNFWDNEKVLWSKGEQNKELEIFGDKILTDDKNKKLFAHFYSINEMKEELKNTGFTILEIKPRFEIVEIKKTEKNTENTVFYIAKK